MSTRHAKPTTVQLVDRIYRKQIAMAANMTDIGDIALQAKEHIVEVQGETRSALAMLSQRLELMRVLADHCARLLREKETIHKQLLAMQAKKTADDFMTAPLRAFPNILYESIPTLHSEITPFDKEKYAADVMNASFCAVSHLHRPGVRCAVCQTTFVERP